MKAIIEFLQENLVNENAERDVMKLPEYKKLKGNTEIWFTKYDRGGTPEINIVKFKSKDKLEAIKRLVEIVNTYISAEDLEISGDHFVYDGDDITVEDMIDRITESNGDGCDCILKFIYNKEDIIDGSYAFQMNDVIYDAMEEETIEFIQK